MNYTLVSVPFLLVLRCYGLINTRLCANIYIEVILLLHSEKSNAENVKSY